ncbi:CRAL/TRIO domain-containing protein [Marasmius fiardii PR-910]|nr:CRAL/TRIO domain-containing protein [Marasmius fiardii PR-910]
MTELSQEAKLEEFRRELFDEGILHEGDSIGTDDETLKRFLRARSYDLIQSKKMFRDAQHWRKTVEGVGIDELYKQIDPFDYPEREDVFESWPIGFHKTDKQGRALNFHILGGMNLNKLYLTCTPERHWHTILVYIESLTREAIPAALRSQKGKPIASVFVIVDLEGFGFSHFWQIKGFVHKCVQVLQDYYPEILGSVFLINAAPSFTYIWAIVRPWLAKETADKVEIISATDSGERLLDSVDVDSLPGFLGGNCKCEEAGGCKFSNTGPWLEGRKGWGPKSTGDKDVQSET